MMSSEKMRLQVVGVVASAVLMSLMSLMSACGGSQSGSDKASSEASQSKASEPMPVKDTAFGDMVGTMDRARGVEKTEMEHKEELDRAIDKNAGSPPAE